jgi:hypothetical protein
MAAIQIGCKIVHVPRDAYAGALGPEKHVFLAGNLQRPTDYPFIPETRLEFAVCSYEAGDDGQPHWHASVTEYELVTEGRIGYLDIAADEMTWAESGDFLSVPAGVCVKRLVPEKSSTVAVKVPSSAEKTHCDACPRECKHRLMQHEDGGPPRRG